MRPCLNQLLCSYKENYKLLFKGDLYKQPYEYRRCNRCNLVFHDPNTDETKIREHYSGYGSYSTLEGVARQFHSNRRRNLRLGKRLLKYMEVDKPRVLEIGCSNGVLLRHFKELGFDTYGVELDSEAANIAIEHIGKKKIFSGVFGDSPFLDIGFDLIICKQTIEHVPNPFELLLQIKSALKTGGILYLDTPNFGGLSARLLKDRWKNFLPGDHISMFTPNSLLHFIREAGFDLLKKRVGGFAFNQRRNTEGGYLAYNNNFMKISFRLFGLASRYFRIGDGISIIAKRSS